jgi:hypothetical protein
MPSDHPRRVLGLFLTPSDAEVFAIVFSLRPPIKIAERAALAGAAD